VLYVPLTNLSTTRSASSAPPADLTPEGPPGITSLTCVSGGYPRFGANSTVFPPARQLPGIENFSCRHDHHRVRKCSRIPFLEPDFRDVPDPHGFVDVGAEYQNKLGLEPRRLLRPNGSRHPVASCKVDSLRFIDWPLLVLGIGNTEWQVRCLRHRHRGNHR